MRRNKWFSREPARRATTPETGGSYPAKRASERAERPARIREDTDVKLALAVSRAPNCSEVRKPNGGVAFVYNEIARRQDDSETSTMRRRRAFRDDRPVRERVATS